MLAALHNLNKNVTRLFYDHDVARESPEHRPLATAKEIEQPLHVLDELFRLRPHLLEVLLGPRRPRPQLLHLLLGPDRPDSIASRRCLSLSSAVMAIAAGAGLQHLPAEEVVQLLYCPGTLSPGDELAAPAPSMSTSSGSRSSLPASTLARASCFLLSSAGVFGFVEERWRLALAVMAIAAGAAGGGRGEEPAQTTPWSPVLAAGETVRRCCRRPGGGGARRQPRASGYRGGGHHFLGADDCGDRLDQLISIIDRSMHADGFTGLR